MVRLNVSGKQFFLIISALILTISPFCYAIKNYDNNPDLAKAMGYDLEMNRGNTRKADRSQAERYYLEYLKTLTAPEESFQRAAVYSQLGALYSIAVNYEKNEKPVYEKAIFYLKKVLEEEPERYGYDTRRARRLLIKIEDREPMDRIKASMDFYHWLDSYDKEKMKKWWLPVTKKKEIPLDPKLPEKQQRAYRRLYDRYKNPNNPTAKVLNRYIREDKKIKEQTIVNACTFTGALDDPNQGFEYMLSELPVNSPQRPIVDKHKKQWFAGRERLKSFTAAKNTSSPVKILFVGNSYTYCYGGLDFHLNNMLKSSRSSLKINADHIAKGAYTFEKHWYDTQVTNTIKNGDWDIVILQEQSTLPMRDPEKMFTYARKLDALIKESGAKTVFFMTWPRSYTPDRITGLAQAYNSIGDELEALVVPVGRAWQRMRHAHPTLNLYDDDGSHPNEHGMYLNVCVFYASIFQKNPVGNPYRGFNTISAEERAVLQKTAWDVVD